MIRNIYGFTDSGKKVKVGEYDDGARSVGGRIFYIDSNSDETVEFYDAQGNVIQNVSVGDTPAYYKVTSAGVSGKDKFYVYAEVSPRKYGRWTYYEGDDPVYGVTGFTSQTIGSGKSNTSGIMAIQNGIYYSWDNVIGHCPIWYYIKEWQSNKLNGCPDWYAGSKDELETLRLFIADNISKLEIANLFSTYQWSSSESSETESYEWKYTTSEWTSDSKNGVLQITPIRSF